MATEEKSPIIVQANLGPKIPFQIIGNSISINNDELIIDLSKRERDHDVLLDISQDYTNGLVMGISKKYIVQINIPARLYTTALTSDNTNSIETTDSTIRLESYTKTAIKFDISRVVITLWSL